MVTVGSVTREAAAERFPFLAHKYPGRRAAIKAFTHRDPDFVFWIHPDGSLHNARDSHLRNTPRGYEWILDDEPDYGGFLRGRESPRFSTINSSSSTAAKPLLPRPATRSRNSFVAWRNCRCGYETTPWSLAITGIFTARLRMY